MRGTPDKHWRSGENTGEKILVEDRAGNCPSEHWKVDLPQGVGCNGKEGFSRVWWCWDTELCRWDGSGAGSEHMQVEKVPQECVQPRSANLQGWKSHSSLPAPFPEPLLETKRQRFKEVRIWELLLFMEGNLWDFCPQGSCPPNLLNCQIST